MRLFGLIFKIVKLSSLDDLEGHLLLARRSHAKHFLINGGSLMADEHKK